MPIRRRIKSTKSESTGHTDVSHGVDDSVASEGSWGNPGIPPTTHIPAESGSRKPEGKNTSSTLDLAPVTDRPVPHMAAGLKTDSRRGSGPPRLHFSMTSDKYY